MATVRVYKNVPISSTSKNKIRADRATLLNELDNYLAFPEFTVSFVRGGLVELPLTQTAVESVNYLAFNNGRGWFFAFVTDAIWTSVRGCALQYEIDYFTTFISDITFGKGVLRRSNSKDLTLSGSGFVWNVGDYLPTKFQPITKEWFNELDGDNPLDRVIDEWAYLVYVTPPSARWLGAIDPQYNYSKTPVFQRIALCETPAQLKLLTLYFLGSLAYDIEDIVSIYAIPKYIADEIEYTTETKTFEIDGVDYSATFRFVNQNNNPLTWEYNIIPEHLISESWTPLLWRRGYSFVEVSLFGNNYNLQPEEISEKLGYLGKLKVYFSIGDSPSLSITVEYRTSQYDGELVKKYTPLTTIDFPKLSVTQSTLESVLGINGLSNITSAIASSLTSFGEEGAMVSLAGGLNTTSMLASTLGSIKGATSSGNAMGSSSNGVVPLYVRWVIPTEEERNVIFDNLNRNGLSFNQVCNINDIINDSPFGYTVVVSGCYIQADDVVIYGDVPQVAIDTIRTSITDGMRLFSRLSSLKNG